MMTEEADRNFIIVGSGAAGLVGAITAHLQGLRPMIVEKAECWGGTTALSGGVIWAPDNRLMRQAGETDDRQEIDRYIRALLGQDANPRQVAKAERYPDAVNAMLDMLADQGVRWQRNADHPDYYPLVPGARPGRTLEAALFDGKRLGPQMATMRNAKAAIPAFPTAKMGRLVRAKTGIGPFATAATVMASNVWWKARGHTPLALGRALLGALMELVQSYDIPVLLGTRLVDLCAEDGRVASIMVEDAGGLRRLSAPAGVLLAAGGFARNSELRRQHQQDVDGSWSNASEDDQGDALVIGMRAGALTEYLDDAWWQPTIMVAPGQPSLTLGERALPGSIIVDETGRRYMNEAQSYMMGGGAMRRHGGATKPHWLIFGQGFPRRYILRTLSNKDARASMLAHGYWRTADTIEGLATACALDPRSLSQTIERFNGFARNGLDEDFHRGKTDYDRYWADPAHGPNPSLGEIRRGPFHAVRIFPGDIGTNGGLMTDAQGRVLAQGEQPMDGLYAAGNCASSPFRHSYPGGGATIGAAMTFGYIAASDAAQRDKQAVPPKSLIQVE